MDDERFDLYLNPADSARLRAWAHDQRVSLREANRQLTHMALDQLDRERAEDPSPMRRTKKTRFLESIQEKWSFAFAVMELDLDPTEVETWLLDPKFLRRYHLAQRCYIDTIEQAQFTGDACRQLGRVAFLNAHHPAYGRLRREQINRIINQAVKRLMRLLEEELGGSQKDLVKRLVEKFSAWQNMKVSAYTDASVK